MKTTRHILAAILFAVVSLGIQAADFGYDSVLDDAFSGNIVKTDTYKCALLSAAGVSAASISAHTRFSDVTGELATGSGYTAGVATGEAPQQIPAIPIVVARAVACLNLRSGIKPTMQTITGNTARIEITVADLNDTPIDPDQITIKIIEPSQPETTATPVKDAAGHYHHDVLLTRPGKWYWRVETGGQPAAASEGQINVLQSRFG